MRIFRNPDVMWREEEEYKEQALDGLFKDMLCLTRVLEVFVVDKAAKIFDLRGFFSCRALLRF